MSNYTITTNDVAAPDDDPTNQNFSGWLMATSTYSTSALVSVFSSGKLPGWNWAMRRAELCGCQMWQLNNNNGGKATIYFSVNRLTNLPNP